MNKLCVLDASAMIAAIKGEPGGDEVAQHLPDAIISSVNFSEVATYLIRKGMTLAKARALLNDFSMTVIAFDETQAVIAASLWPKTSAKGLSLADRACLSLAMDRKLPVLTGDRIWKTLGLDVKIVEFRP